MEGFKIKVDALTPELSTFLKEQGSKPEDASDVDDLEKAKETIFKLRSVESTCKLFGALDYRSKNFILVNELCNFITSALKVGFTDPETLVTDLKAIEKSKLEVEDFLNFVYAEGNGDSSRMRVQDLKIAAQEIRKLKSRLSVSNLNPDIATTLAEKDEVPS